MFYAFTKEPFSADIGHKEILQTDALAGVCERFDYAVRQGAVALVTGDVGSGNSTALRYAVGRLHQSEYRWFYITATSGPILELYRYVAESLGTEAAGTSRTVLLSRIRKAIDEMAKDRKMKLVMVIEEASLLNPDVFAELHSLLQFVQDARSLLPVILAGQSSLVDKLMYRTAMPLK